MEALEAIGLAAAIVQFVEFGATVIKGANDIYSTGTTEANRKLDTYASSLLNLSSSIKSHVATPNATQRTSPGLQELVAACETDCNDILVILQSLRIQGTKQRMLRSLKVSLKQTRSDKKLAALQANLERTQAAISLHIANILSADLKTVGRDVSKLADEVKGLHIRNGDHFTSITESLRSLESHSAPTATGFSSQQLQNTAEVLTTILSTQSQMQKEGAIVASLGFEQRKRRFDAIAEAHKKTLEWIYDTNLANWLETKSGIFWVSGKAGSGKSTLLKFIPNNPKTHGFVANWAAGAVPIISSHYFWSSGTDMQKSLLGLLQSLLFDIYRQHPALIPLASPGRWRSLSSAPVHVERMDPWAQQELIDALVLIANLEDSPVKICLFVDGLDEFSGDHLDLCNLLKSFSKSAHVKLCVSSRPWNVFETAFGHDSLTALAIHEHTLEDIRSYTRDRLQEHPRWDQNALSGTQPTTRSQQDSIIDQITSSANGVFLWVRLVVNSLREGLTNDDTIADLQRRLDSLPTDLEELFRHMLQGVDPIYHRKMAGMFRLALDIPRPLPLEVYYAHDRECDIEDYAMRLPISPLDQAAWQDIQRATRRQINARSRGLLEVNHSVRNIPMRTGARHVEETNDKEGGDVGFIHRSVCDFFKEDEMDQYLITTSAPNHQSMLSVLYASLVRIKIRPKKPRITCSQIDLQTTAFAFPPWYRGQEFFAMFEHQRLFPWDNAQFAAAAFRILDEVDRVECVEAGTPAAFRKAVLLNGPRRYLSAKLSLDRNYLLCLKPSPFHALGWNQYKPTTPESQSKGEREDLMDVVKELVAHGYSLRTDSGSTGYISAVAAVWRFLLISYSDILDPSNLSHDNVDRLQWLVDQTADPNVQVTVAPGSQISAFALFLVAIVDRGHIAALFVNDFHPYQVGSILAMCDRFLEQGAMDDDIVFDESTFTDRSWSSPMPGYKKWYGSGSICRWLVLGLEEVLQCVERPLDRLPGTIHLFSGILHRLIPRFDRAPGIVKENADVIRTCFDDETATGLLEAAARYKPGEVDDVGGA
ncbi:hypothetical protein QBC39DRAFT_345978 [Podospora conica]|nr:hypothetical protein QBC39DRAFT_345978 [Schizothecium conicum]